MTPHNGRNLELSGTTVSAKTTDFIFFSCFDIFFEDRFGNTHAAGKLIVKPVNGIGSENRLYHDIKTKFLYLLRQAVSTVFVSEMPQ